MKKSSEATDSVRSNDSKQSGMVTVKHPEYSWHMFNQNPDEAYARLMLIPCQGDLIWLAFSHLSLISADTRQRLRGVKCSMAE